MDSSTNKTEVVKLVILNIEIGCAPGRQRPNIYFKNILELLEKNDNSKIKEWALNNKEKEPDVKLFGDWEWNIPIEDEILKNVQNTFQISLTNYYNLGAIRYGSW